MNYFSSLFQGKTSLVHALVYGQDGNIQPDDRTVGLDYYTWKLKPLEDPIEVLLVDCAGQRQYLLTHQFFFAQGKYPHYSYPMGQGPLLFGKQNICKSQ